MSTCCNVLQQWPLYSLSLMCVVRLMGNLQGHNQQFWPMHVTTFCNNDHCISLSLVCVPWDWWKIWTIERWWNLPKRHSNCGYIYTTLLSFITLYHHEISSKKSSTFAICVGEVCCHIPSRISLLWPNNSTKEPPQFAWWKILQPITMLMWGC